MTAEEIYPCIKDDTEEETLDQHAYDDAEGGQQGRQSPPRPPEPQNAENPGAADSGSGAQPPQTPGGPAARPAPLSTVEREALAVQWQQRLAGAAQQAMQAGKLGGSMARLVDHLLQPQLPWRMLLARYMTAIARDDYSYMRPSRREGSAIFPSLRSARVDLLVALDISGSVSATELNEFLSEVNAIKGQLQARITLHACDTRLVPDGPWVIEAWEEVRLPRAFEGGGGTRFQPLFDWVAAQDLRPDLLVYFTDAQGEFPAREPDYPVLWLVKGKAPVPWGQRIQLN